MKKLFEFSLIFVMVIGLIAEASYGAGAERFDFSDLTATDKSTGLVWTRDANIVNKALTWNEALRFIKQLNGKKYGGFSDWRLPTKDELESLIDYAKKQGYMNNFSDVFNKIGFKNVRVFYYWSSTSNPYDTGDAFGITMFHGGVTSGNKNISSYNVWPVRGGK